MSTRTAKESNYEREISAWSGWFMLVVNALIVLGAIGFLIATNRAAGAGELPPFWIVLRIWGSILWFAAGIVMFFGHFTLQPNEARVLILFGSYKGTVRKSGFHWASPFYSRTRGKEAGENDFLSKPLHEDELLE